MSVFQSLDDQKESVEDSSVPTNQRNPKTFQWYQDLRRKMGSKYYTPRVQQQMLKDAQALGNGFYDKKHEAWEE
jgi:hypothetical protein